MKDYSTKAFAAMVPCAKGTIENWRKGINPLLAPDHEDERGYPRYIEAQLPIARALLNQRKSTLKGKSSPDAVDTDGNISVTPAPMNAPNTNSAQKNIAGAPYTDDTQETNKNVDQNNCNNDTTAAQTSQAGISDSEKFSGKTILENLPPELLTQRRFFPVILSTDKKGNLQKVPTIKEWQKTKKQMTAYEAIKKTGLIGMDICGHGVYPDYFFVDFDHVRDQHGNFLYDGAERWNNYLETAETFHEISIRKCGLHYLFCPSPNKFPALTGEPNHAIYFDENNKGKDAPKIELFHCEGRYILLTGNLFGESNTEIISGAEADEFCQQLCNQLALDTSHIRDVADTGNAPIDSDIPIEEVQKMLAVIPCAKVSYADWFKSAAIIKYHFDDAGFELWRAWSETDPDRYTLEACQRQWGYIAKRSTLKIGRPATIGSLIHFAKQFGYKPPKKSADFAADKDASAQMTQDFIPTCPVNLRIPDNFIFGRKGIKLVIPPKSEKQEPKIHTVTRSPIVVTKILCETKEYSTQYELAYLLGETWRHITIDGRATTDIRALQEIANKGALIEDIGTTAKYLTRLIAINYDALPKTKTYTRPGWHDEKFIYPTPDTGEDYICKRGGFDYSQEFATQGNGNIWKETFLEACENGGAIARIAFGNVFAAPLVRPLNVPNIQCQLDGKSGGGKTALLKFAASTFGNPRKIIRTFGATLKNRQAVAAAYCDLPTFLDELGTLQGGKKGADTLPQMIYDYEQGKTNQAQKRNGEARETFEFFGSCTMTGEFSILKSHDPRGTHKRIIPLDCGEKLFDDEFATELHITAENHFGHFGRQWTKYVETHLEAIRESYLGFTEYIYRQKKINIEPTQLKAITIDAVAYQHFRIAIGEQETFDFIDAAKDILAIISTLPTPADLDDSTRAIKDLGSFIAGHDKYFSRDIKNGLTDGVISVTAQPFESYGKKFDNGEIAFLPHALRKILENELGYQSADALIAEFARKGFLRCTKGRGYRYSTWLNGKSEPTIRFKPNAFPKAPEPEEEEAIAN